MQRKMGIDVKNDETGLEIYFRGRFGIRKYHIVTPIYLKYYLDKTKI
jgi:hypothetical protein